MPAIKIGRPLAMTVSRFGSELSRAVVKFVVASVHWHSLQTRKDSPRGCVSPLTTPCLFRLGLSPTAAV